MLQRYCAIKASAGLRNTIDRLHAKIARKTNMFMEQAWRERMMLADGFAEFQNSIRPGPLTGRTNEIRIRERINTLSSIESKIESFRGTSQL